MGVRIRAVNRQALHISVLLQWKVLKLQTLKLGRGIFLYVRVCCVWFVILVILQSILLGGLLMASFACSSPLGVLVGSILTAEGKLASGICNALGAGTVLYIASEVIDLHAAS